MQSTLRQLNLVSVMLRWICPFESRGRGVPGDIFRAAEPSVFGSFYTPWLCSEAAECQPFDGDFFAVDLRDQCDGYGRKCVTGSLAYLAIDVFAADGGGKLDFGYDLPGLQICLNMWCLIGQSVKIADRNFAFAVWSRHDD